MHLTSYVADSDMALRVLPIDWLVLEVQGHAWRWSASPLANFLLHSPCDITATIAEEIFGAWP